MAPSQSDSKDSGTATKLDRIILGMESLGDNLIEVKQDVKEIRSTMMPRTECEARHNTVEAQLAGLSHAMDLTERLTIGTRNKRPTIEGARTPASDAMLSKAVEVELDHRQDRTRRSISFWLATLGSIFALLGVGSVIGVIRFASRIEASINERASAASKSSTALKNTIERAATEPPRVVYITGSASVPRDAGVAPTGRISATKRVAAKKRLPP